MMLGKVPPPLFSPISFVCFEAALKSASLLPQFPDTGIVSSTIKLDGLLNASEAQSFSAKEETGAVLASRHSCMK